MAEVYLTNDLSFPKETLSMISVVSMPFNIILSGYAGYLSSDNPFPVQCWALLLCMLINGYAVLVLLATFPPKDQITFMTTVHVTLVTLIT